MELLRTLWFSEMDRTFVTTTVMTEPLVQPHMAIVVERLLERSTRATQIRQYAICDDEYILSYTWSIPKFSECSAKLYSPVFQCVDGERWFCTVEKVPGDDNAAVGAPATHLGVFVGCLDTVGDKTITAGRTIEIIHPNNTHIVKHGTGLYGMSPFSEAGWVGVCRGYKRLVSLDALQHRGYIVDDTLTVRITVERKAGQQLAVAEAGG